MAATFDDGLDARVLVLNRAYAAIRVVDARRAFTLLVKNIAEVIAVEDGHYRNYDFETWADIAELQREFEPDRHDWVRTTRVTIAVPKIIRLFDYDRRPRRTVKLNRRNIYTRDGSRCQYCGGSFPTRELTLDHVVPRVQGGENSWTNLVCACVRCNARKGGRTPAQAESHHHRSTRRWKVRIVEGVHGRGLLDGRTPVDASVPAGSAGVYAPFDGNRPPERPRRCEHPSDTRIDGSPKRPRRPTEPGGRCRWRSLATSDRFPISARSTGARCSR